MGWQLAQGHTARWWQMILVAPTPSLTLLPQPEAASCLVTLAMSSLILELC